MYVLVPRVIDPPDRVCDDVDDGYNFQRDSLGDRVGP